MAFEYHQTVPSPPPDSRAVTLRSNAAVESCKVDVVLVNSAPENIHNV